MKAIELQFCSLRRMALYYCRSRAAYFLIGTIKTYITLFQIEPFKEPFTAGSHNFLAKTKPCSSLGTITEGDKMYYVRSMRVEMTILS